MAVIDSLRIEHYTAERVPNPACASGDEWFDVADELVGACLKNGPTWSGCIGPDPGDDVAVSFVFEDTQWNDERYHYVWVDPTAFTREWLSDIVGVLGRFPGWGLGVKNVEQGYMLIFADRVMVTGLPFADCDSIDEIVTQARNNLETLETPEQ